MNNILEYNVIKDDEKKRLDKYISEKNENLSRSMVQKLIKENKILVNNKIGKESYKVIENDKIKIEIEIKIKNFYMLFLVCRSFCI